MAARPFIINKDEIDLYVRVLKETIEELQF